MKIKKYAFLILIFLLFVCGRSYGLEKNTASQKWVIFCFDDTDNSAKTGDAANITGNLRIDGTAANAIDDTNPTELEDGYYVFDITAAESNGENIVICPASSTADIQCIGCPMALWTRPPNHSDMDIDATNGQVDADITYVGGDAITDNNDGRLEVNLEEIADAAVSTSTAQLGVNVVNVEAADATDQIRDAVVDDATRIDASSVNAVEAKLDTVDGIVDTILLDTAAYDTDAEYATAIWNAATASYGGAGTYGQAVEDIIVDTAEIGSAGAGLTAVPWNSSWDAEVESEVDDSIGGGTGTSLTAIPWNASWDSEIESEVDDALIVQELDHLVHVADADDPADNSIVAKLAASDGVWSGFDNSSDSLEALRDNQAAAADAVLMQNTTITVTDQTHFTLGAGSSDDDSYNNMVAVITDQVTSEQKSVRTITDYTGSSKTVTIDSTPDFTIATGDTIDILAVAPGSTPPTAAQIADAVLQESVDDHSGIANSLAEHIDEIQVDTSDIETDLNDGVALTSTTETQIDTIETRIKRLR